MPRAIGRKVNDYELDISQGPDARVATARLVALMLRPKNAEYRRRRWLAFLGKEKDRWKDNGKWEDLTPPLRRTVNRELKVHGKAVRKAKPPSNYLPGPKKAKNKSELRELFSVGLLVLILEELHATDGITTIAEAKSAISERYDGEIWSSNSRSFGAAWAKYKSVAHLCAAWVRLLTESGEMHRDRRDVTILRKRLAEFLIYAAHYEHFLTVAKASGRTFFDRHKKSVGDVKARSILSKKQIWSICEFVEINAATKISNLPSVGLRPNMTSGTLDQPSIP